MSPLGSTSRLRIPTVGSTMTMNAYAIIPIQAKSFPASNDVAMAAAARTISVLMP